MGHLANFSTDSLGNLQFHGLHLKKSLLERFGLPVEIVAGDIGSLSVTIPWTQLKNQPVKIAIEDVYVLARARAPGRVDPAEDERVDQATKQERLRSAEAVDSAAAQVSTGNDESESFVSASAESLAKQTYVGAIISKVVDNVQIHVKGIHVRYEDSTSTPEVSFFLLISLIAAPLCRGSHPRRVQGGLDRRQLGGDIHPRLARRRSQARQAQRPLRVL